MRGGEYNRGMDTERTGEQYLAKAEASRAGAESEFAADRFDNCANRSYYACFQAAIAALLRAGIGPRSRDGQWRHDAVQAQFAEQLIDRRKLFPTNLRGTLERGAVLRASADYSPDQASHVQAARALRRAREFVAAIAEREG